MVPASPYHSTTRWSGRGPLSAETRSGAGVASSGGTGGSAPQSQSDN